MNGRCDSGAGDYEYIAKNEHTALYVPASRGIKRLWQPPSQLVSYTQPRYGTATVNLEDGSFVYEPNSRCWGRDLFEYSLAIQSIGEVAGSVTILVPSSQDKQKPDIACFKNIEMMVGEEIPWVIESSSDN